MKRTAKIEKIKEKAPKKQEKTLLSQSFSYPKDSLLSTTHITYSISSDYVPCKAFDNSQPSSFRLYTME